MKSIVEKVVSVALTEIFINAKAVKMQCSKFI